MLARRREVTVNAALSVGWRREDRAHVGTVCEDGRIEGLLELSFSGLRVPEVFKVMGVQTRRERWSLVESPVGLKI